MAHSGRVDIQWTPYDVPHITAETYEGLGFGYGYALARDRLCETAGRTLILRGERSRYYGPDAVAVVGFLRTTNLNSDLMYRLRLPDAWVQEEFDALQPNTQDYVRGVAAGLNHYVDTLSEAERTALCPEEPVPTFTESDIVRAAMAFGVGKELIDVGPSLLTSASAWTGTETPRDDSRRHTDPVGVEQGFGSNGWVYGADVVEGGGAMMVANPHSAWARTPHEQRIYMHQVHLTIPGELDVAGASFLGMPSPLTGFNADVAWTILHAGTVTPYVLQAMDVQESPTEPTYTVDGIQKPLAFREVSVDVLEEDGTLGTRTYAFAQSELGPLYKLAAAPGRPAGWYAITNPGERNARGLDQFLAVARATSTRDLIRAVEAHRGILAQLLVADRHGEVAYVLAGNILPIPDDQMRACALRDPSVAFNILDGRREACAFRDAEGRPEIAPPSFYPTVVSRGIIHNTNNSYKYSEYGAEQPSYPMVFGIHADDDGAKARVAAGLRYDPRLVMSARRLAEITAQGVVTPDDALQVLFDNRNYAAETFLDDILALCDGADDDAVREGCTVLQAWDRRNNADSRGALLFHQAWSRVVRIEGLLDVDPSGDPDVAARLVLTPRTAPAVVEALGAAVRELKDLGFAADTPWGAALSMTAEGERIPLHGGSYQEGILNGEMPAPLTEEGFPTILFGTAYVQRVRWEQGEVIADVLLSHGQRDGVETPGRTAQLTMFSDKTLYRFPFTAAQVSQADSVERVVLTVEARE
ncbi:penicillin acylase family protein [Roseospira marina]|uniref:Penicillin acylase family protein n=1 Tax=Roseospira marina TaxID=140057 RepID=A0A5M6I984_9PROT|nr:penicillin acylase family protein [Roseospira marina]KAA5604325.1 penicillin acylase family protein [Roseospira marina]MBB4315651.1 acyl-homoserine-lactone acylase [Roseospira marina]MBB5088709.1 acyl-homoserine-lactone acylase [Roseospira marina]